MCVNRIKYPLFVPWVSDSDIMQLIEVLTSMLTSPRL